MDTDELRRFVLDVCDGKVVTSAGMLTEEIRTCFMVLALAEPGQIPNDTAVVWEYLSKAGPTSINGMPCFFSCHYMNAETWERVSAAIKAEMKRRESIEV